jgi:hypothetical protein
LRNDRIDWRLKMRMFAERANEMWNKQILLLFSCIISPVQYLWDPILFSSPPPSHNIDKFRCIFILSMVGLIFGFILTIMAGCPARSHCVDSKWILSFSRYRSAYMLSFLFSNNNLESARSFESIQRRFLSIRKRF